MKKYFFSLFFLLFLFIGAAHATGGDERRPLMDPVGDGPPQAEHMGDDGACGEKCNKACCFCCCCCTKNTCKDCPQNCKDCPANCKDGCKFNAKECHDANCVDCCKSAGDDCCSNKCCDKPHGCANCAIKAGKCVCTTGAVVAGAGYACSNLFPD
jgi:hypothetical protein